MRITAVWFFVCVLLLFFMAKNLCVLFMYMQLLTKNIQITTAHSHRIKRQNKQLQREISNFQENFTDWHSGSFLLCCPVCSHEHVPIWMMMFRELSDQRKRCLGTNIVEAFAFVYNMARCGRKLIVNCSASNAMYRIIYPLVLHLFSRLATNSIYQYRSPATDCFNRNNNKMTTNFSLAIRSVSHMQRERHDFG